MDLDLDFPRFDDDDIVLPDAEPFPEMVLPGTSIHRASSEVPREHESSDSAEAPLRRKRRGPKLLPVDQRMELHNADLAQWKKDYAENMAEAIEAKKHHKAPALAKKNAAFWVFGSGIGGVGAGLGISKLKSPLDMFAGDAMMEALTGIRTSTAGQKRSRDSENGRDSESETRRVRSRAMNESDQIGRGEGLMLDDDGMLMSEVRIAHYYGNQPLMHADRVLKSADMLRLPSRTQVCRGTSAPPLVLVKDLSCAVVDSPAVLAVFPAVLAVPARCHAPETLDPARLTDVPAGSPAPALLLVEDYHAIAVLNSLWAMMTMTDYREAALCQTIKRLMIFSSMALGQLSTLRPQQTLSGSGRL